MWINVPIDVNGVPFIVVNLILKTCYNVVGKKPGHGHFRCEVNKIRM